MEYYKGKIYLFGGMLNYKEFSNQLWVYNISLNIWNKKNGSFNGSINPPLSAGHAMIMYQNYLIVFGGFNRVDKTYVCYNSVFIYDCDNNIWNNIECKNKPNPRFYHGMCISNNKLIIHGGLNVNDKTQSDMYWIDINSIINNESPIWIKIDNNIGPLYGHLILSKDNAIYCFGGNTQFKDFLQNNSLVVWYQKYNKKAISKIKRIKRRSNHDGCIIYLGNKHYIFVFGGVTSQTQFNDAFLIDIDCYDTDDNFYDTIPSNTIHLKQNNHIEMLQKTNDANMDSIQNYMNTMETMQTQYKDVVSLLKPNSIDDEKLGTTLNDDVNTEDVFKEYFMKEFRNIKSNMKYYDNLVENELNSIDAFILLENIDDINEYIKPKNKIHGILILNKINEIRQDRKKLKYKLKKDKYVSFYECF